MDDICKWNFIIVESLGITTPDYYFYLNQSGTYKVDGVNDVKEFEDTMVCILSVDLAHSLNLAYP